MGKISSKINRQQQAYPSEKFSVLDKYLNRLAQLSQFLVLLLGVFGYFYTVLPLYQKALLDEDIAKKTLELNQKTQEVYLLADQIKTRTAELALKDGQLKKLGVTAKEATEQRQIAEAKALDAASDANTNYAKIRREYLGSVFSRIQSCSSAQLLRFLSSPNMADEFSRSLLATDFQTCINKVVDGSKSLIGTLKPSEMPRLIQSAASVVAELNPEYVVIVKALQVKLEPLYSELAPIEVAYTGSKNLKVNSPEWNAAINSYFGRGLKLREEIRMHQSGATVQYEKLLKRATEMIWKDLSTPS